MAPAGATDHRLYCYPSVRFRVLPIRPVVQGYPFEVAKPDEIFHFFRDKGFHLVEMATQAGDLGCNEFVFVKQEAVDK